MTRNNSFDILRLLAAGSVIWFHHALMFGNPLPVYSKGFEVGSIGVQVFFSISGFLVALSFSRSNGFIPFIEKRIRRIFPGLFVCAFAMVYLMAPIFKENILEYITSFEAFKSFVKVSMLYGQRVDGLWTGYGLSNNSNGPLWTLPYEFMLYLIVGSLLSIHSSWKTPAIALIVCIVSLVAFQKDMEKIGIYYSNISGLAYFGINFFLGSLMFMTKDLWTSVKCRISFVTISALLLFILKDTGDIKIIGAACITILTIVVGVSFGDVIINGRFDISYGLYIWGWPVQIIVMKNISEDYHISLAVTLLITALIATASWFLVEKRFLKRK